MSAQLSKELLEERARITKQYETGLIARLHSGDAAVIDEQRYEAVLRNNDLMDLAYLVPPANESGQGRPSRYPTWVWLYLTAMYGTQGSQRKAMNWLRLPRNWFWVIDTICEIHGEHLRETIDQRPPSRSTVRHHLKRVMRVQATLEKHCLSQWVRQAQEQGCLIRENSGTWMEPARGATVWGDGTVVKSPVRQRSTGEKPVRTAEASTYYECGEETGNPVWGRKYITISTRPSSTPYGRVILTMEAQEGTREAEQGVRMIERIQQQCGGLIKAVAWDGAHRGQHRQHVLRHIGALPVTPPHASTKARRLRQAADGTDLWTKGGALCARTLTHNGTATYTPLPLHDILRRKNSDGTFRFYGEYALPSGLIHRERFDQTLADTVKNFNRPEHLQPFPKDTPQYKEVYRRRPDAESLHDTLDSLFYKGRMIAYNRDRQDLAMFAFALGQNAVSRWVHKLAERHHQAHSE